MAERISKAQRSANMSRIKGKDTKPELLVRRMRPKATWNSGRTSAAARWNAMPAS
ncbi:hypothetical protein [Arthrobacter sp. H14-L1]|uniref:hypothetical protein n=1 Tax=Arthrobacter sp. H14-L1 TaxID=2996697 RepID=UPI002D1E365E|nr:hypothetical protein [Arthrobacter sp. H14-L1]